MTLNVWRTRSISPTSSLPYAIVKRQACAIARVVCRGAGIACLYFPLNARGWRAEKALPLVQVHALLPRRGASRRATAASLSAAGPRFRRSLRVPLGPKARPLLGGRSLAPRASRAAHRQPAPGGGSLCPRAGAPAAAREGEVRSSPPRGHRIRPHHRDVSRRRPSTNRTDRNVLNPMAGVNAYCATAPDDAP